MQKAWIIVPFCCHLVAGPYQDQSHWQRVFSSLEALNRWILKFLSDLKISDYLFKGIACYVPGFHLLTKIFGDQNFNFHYNQHPMISSITSLSELFKFLVFFSCKTYLI